MRKTISILLCFVLIFSAAACGGSGDVKAQDKPASPAPAVSEAAGKNVNDKPSAGNLDEKEPSAVENAAEAVPDSSQSAFDSQVEALVSKYDNLTQDNLTWEYDSSSRTLIVSGEGPMRSYGDEEPEWFVYSEEAETVVIGDSVTSVSAGAFLWFSSLVTVQLGESVEYIGDSAFSNCNIWYVNYPSSLKYIGDYAFNSDMLHSDSGFTLPEGLLYVGDSAFRSAFKENTLYIPASLAHIGNQAFANTFLAGCSVDPGNPSYTSVSGILYDKNMTTLLYYPPQKEDSQLEIPETVTKIASEAIEVTNSLERIYIPSSVTEIEESAIFWNYGLTSIDVSPDNGSYKSVDGVLFSKDGRHLLAYPVNSDRTEYTVPEGTEIICPYSMSQARHLNRISFNEGLLEIGKLGLYDSEAVASVDLPSSLRTVGLRAFGFCDSLSEINYSGSSADWQSISFDEGNEILTGGSVSVRCAG